MKSNYYLYYLFILLNAGNVYFSDIINDPKGTIISGNINKNDINTIKKLKTDTKFILKSDISLDPEAFSEFLNALRQLSIKAIINLDQLTEKNHGIIIQLIIENIDIFAHVTFGELNDYEDDLLNKIKELKWERYSYDSISTNKGLESRISQYVNPRTKNKYYIKYVKTVAQDPLFHYFFGEAPQGVQGGNMANTNKKESPEVARLQWLLKQKNVFNTEQAQRVQLLINKVNSRSSNNPNEADKSKLNDQVKTIAGMFMSEEEDKANNNYINQMASALTRKDGNTVNTILNTMEKNTWNHEKMVVTDSGKQTLFYLKDMVKSIANNKFDNAHSTSRRRHAILLYGEPGVGKTRVAQAFADANGIPKCLVNAGNEAKFFTGSLVTYVNAEEGAFARGLWAANGIEKIKQNKGNSTVIFIIDEIDKCSAEVQASLLAALDPAQGFKDQLLDIELPLNNVIFVCTSNSLNISAPLLDRCKKVQVNKLTDHERVQLIQKIITVDLVNKYSNITFNIPDKIYKMIARKSPGSSARILEQNCSYVIGYIENLLLSFQGSNMVITEDHINEALKFVHVVETLIKSEESRIGYINGVVYIKTLDTSTNRYNYSYSVTNFNCNISDSQTVIIPTDHTIQIVPYIYKAVSSVLSSMQLSVKHVSMNIKDTDVDFHDQRSLSSLIAIAWISLVANRAVRSQGTIIADMLGNGDLEFDNKTLMKIQIAYGSGMRYMVIGRTKPTTAELEEGKTVSNVFAQLSSSLKLVRKNSADKNKEIYVHESGKDASYSGLEICVVDNLKEAADYLLIKQ